MAESTTDDAPILSEADKKEQSRKKLALANLLLALAAVVISVANVFWSTSEQRELTRMQVVAQDRAAELQSRTDLIAILAANLGNINLETEGGKAAFAICLTAAQRLDQSRLAKEPAFTQLLPRYDRDYLRENLTTDYPDVLTVALKHLGPPRDVPIDKGFYTAIETLPDAPGVRTRLDAVSANMRGMLDQSPVTSPLRIFTYERKGKAKRFSVIVGNRVYRKDAERRKQDIARVTGRNVSVIKATEFNIKR